MDMYKRAIVKALLDSGATGIFIDREFAEEQGFKLEKLDKPLEVKNVDGIDNNGGRIEYEIKCNIVTNRLDPIEELYNMYSEEEDTPRIVEVVDDGLDFDSDIEGLANPYMDL